MTWVDFVGEAFSKPGSRRIRLALSLLFILLATAIAMIIFQAAKTILDPDITLSESHLHTIIFISIMAPIIALFVLLRFEKLYGKIAEENQDRKRTGEALRESEERFRTLADNIPNLAWMAKADGWIFWYNKQWYDYTGTTLEEMQGWGWQKVHHPDYVKAVTGEWSARIKEGKPYDNIFPLRGKDGSYRWFLTRVTPIRDETGKIQRWLGTNTDITERMHAEEALRESEERFRQLADNSPIPMAINDKDDNIIYLNKKFIETFGYTLEDIPHLSYWWPMAYPDPEYREEAIKRWDKGVEEAVRKSKEIGPIDYIVTCKDGSVRYTEITGTPIDDKELVLLQDVTKRKRAEEALRRSEANLARAQRITRLGNWTWDVKGDRVEGSAEFFRMFGFDDRQYIVYDEFLARLHPDDREPVDRAVRAALSGMIPYFIDYRIVLPDGVERVIHAEAEVTRENAGQPVTMFGTVQDVTERKRAEEALNEAKAQAELYLDLMGHDISNYNQAAMGFLELALTTLEREKRLMLGDKLLIERPLAALQNSSKLIENVRKLQRLMKEGVKTESIDLCEVLKKIDMENFSQKGREITISIYAIQHCHVDANELLQDIFVNLITNAIKHSNEEKPLTIYVKVEPVSHGGRMYYQCAVEDNGPGIPDELKPKLFNRLVRGTTKAHGKGLGLYLIRTLVDGYGGKVWVEDRVPGDHTKGARFVVMLPAVE